MKQAVLSLSGGMDSTSLLIHLLANEYQVKAYSFDYGQRHSLELERLAKNIHYLQSLQAPVVWEVINLRSAFSDSTSSLLPQSGVEVPIGHYEDEMMKNTIIENRNAIFSSILYGKALAWANKTKGDVQICLGTHSGDHCFSRNTSVLTPDRGVVHFTELKVGDKVLSLNLETNIYEEDLVKDIIQKNKVESLLEITSSSGKLELTSEHNVYRIKYSNFHKVFGWEKCIEKCNVSDLQIGDYLVSIMDSKILKTNSSEELIDLLPITEKLVSNYSKCCIIEKDERLYLSSRGSISNGKYRTMSLPRFCNKQDLFSLMSWYITEGWSNNTSPEETRAGTSRFFAQISQSFSKNPHKCDHILELVKKLNTYSPVEYSSEKQNNLSKEITFSFSGIISLLMMSCGHRSDTKHIPSWMWNELIKDSNLSSIILENLIEGDGYTDPFLRSQYISNSKELIKQVSFLSNKIGLSNDYSYPNGKSSVYTVGLLRKGRKVGAVCIGEAKFSKVLSIKEIDYNDYVFDLSIEKNHNFLAGDFGQLLISNSIYPDCRPEFHEAIDYAFKIGNWGSERVSSYLPYLKGDKFSILQDCMNCCSFLGLDFDTILRNTNTCYQPNTDGESCGKCGSCVERLEAFQKLGRKDPVQYVKE